VQASDAGVVGDELLQVDGQRLPGVVLVDRVRALECFPAVVVHLARIVGHDAGRAHRSHADQHR
jgi:hypothetical protein